ncbi:lysophospholipid acyltransferase family protein [Rhodalgimonas zhirmunskyi]|uniref:Lysophospholipid acyltransferase family protein n=1 Tax=Rhodalgimonas zhirmunskyi TaxID=2964767 RepID=A0AAJ1X675_9RHOB|nr:lysophospholipid acyltransferase family protein [Rhodoalgimonas zhirmunskyi]MDQ2094434.1 lysophospholipid acyltransferase family protein [Rhodoalgimonas zhirmunskyi]
MSTDTKPISRKHRLQFAAIRAALGLMRALPYRWRVPVAGWIVSRIVSPLAGWPGRIRDNLSLIRPDLDRAEVARIIRACPDNFGRTLAELFSPDEFVARVQDIELEGPGLAALEQARTEGRPSILVSGHFGNYDVVRAAVIARGFEVGGIYRPMNIPQFNEIYVDTISQVGEPLFSRGRRGMAQMMRFLKGGGTLAVLIDQRLPNGEPLQFFGHRAYTALSFAELALKYNATVVPCYGIRQDDGLSFRAVLEAPVPHSTPTEMTQALNDSLEARVRQHMSQWLWFHRRWQDIAPTQGDDT